MPNEELSSGFIETAEYLAASSASNEATLRRAISSCYYSVFHALAKLVADSLVGVDPNTRPKKDWIEVYRGLNHNTCRVACSNANSINFPEDIKQFSEALAQLRKERHKVDCDPTYNPEMEYAEFLIALAKKSLNGLKVVKDRDKKAFSALVLISGPGAKAARDLARQND